MSRRFKRWKACNKCCTSDLCNFGNCSSSIHPSIPPPQTTILVPVKCAVVKTLAHSKAIDVNY
ncbi:hypothetical protein CHS0354_042417 [Potamilus streckersoni]|uniref:Uncharacterized protein n=1 Tax=Potamilus streckersoni TaxID=2493646 RepID=A0AAE0SUB9_9BIVA|nr:hypothetical protein CHS0354_042417 [Potamilus streckersoni]